jgi:hypothetical protein
VKGGVVYRRAASAVQQAGLHVPPSPRSVLLPDCLCHHPIPPFCGALPHPELTSSTAALPPAPPRSRRPPPLPTQEALRGETSKLSARQAAQAENERRAAEAAAVRGWKGLCK